MTLNDNYKVDTAYYTHLPAPVYCRCVCCTRCLTSLLYVSFWYYYTVSCRVYSSLFTYTCTKVYDYVITQHIMTL